MGLCEEVEVRKIPKAAVAMMCIKPYSSRFGGQTGECSLLWILGFDELFPEVKHLIPSDDSII
jgi:hypothetical protein